MSDTMRASRWHRRPDVLWRRTLVGVMVARPEIDGPDPVNIRGGGVGVWELLAVPLSFASLVDELAVAYGADRKVVESDVEAVLTDLDRQGYVVRI